MAAVGWIVVIALFALGMIGAVMPVLPGALAIYAAFFAYGLFISFEPFGVWFWIIETLILAVLHLADYVVSAWGVKKYGGSKLSVWGSTIGVLLGPFVIPAFGLIIGPFLGAVLGELLSGSPLDKSLKVGWGSLVGLFSSTVAKILLQLVMIAVFVIWVAAN